MKWVMVVDTSVARAASGRPGAGFPSPQCTQALEYIGSNYLIAMSKELREEWKRHQTQYAENWLAEQIGRKRVKLGAAHWPDEVLLLEAAQSLPGNGPTEVQKDLHLVALAMTHDKRVVSNDLRQRSLLRRISELPDSVRSLMWASVAAGEAIPWLETGCPEQNHLKVGVIQP